MIWFNKGSEVWEDVENAADVKDVGIYRVVAKGVEGTYYDGMTTYGTYDGESFSISPRSVTITAASAEKKYDGTALTNDKVTVTEGTLCDGDTLEAEATGSATYVADTALGNNPIAEGYKVMHGNTDVTDNYAITTVAGTLTINPKAVTITAQNKEFTYDGEAHSWPYYDVTGLVGNDAITAVVTGSITTPSESPKDNVVESYQFTTGTAGNYVITTEPGTLTVKPKPVTVAAQSKAFTYDGEAHSWPEYEVTGLVGSDAIVATVTGSISSADERRV